MAARAFVRSTVLAKLNKTMFIIHADPPKQPSRDLPMSRVNAASADDVRKALGMFIV
jgi:hypothetical protein